MDSYDNEEPVIPSDVIEKCFFISDGEGDESTPDDEVLLYFYPAHVPASKQALLSGAVVSLVHYLSEFTTEPIRTLSMSRVKFAVIQKGKYLLAASGPSSEADSVLVNHVETLYAAYSFYWGPIEQVGNRFAGRPRKNLVRCVQMQCRTLVPLLNGFCEKGKLNAFVWLPFSSPPPNTARHFMQASNILSSIQTEREVYGGCMFFDSSVLCTHIDVEITRWMLSLVDLIRQDKDRGRHNRESSLSRAAFVPVYLTAEQCQRYGEGEGSELCGADAEGCRLGIEDGPEEGVPVSMVRGEADEDEVEEQEDSDPIGVFRTEMLVDDLNAYEDTDQGRYVSLCVFFLDKISLALLMTKHADSRSWHVIVRTDSLMKPRNMIH